MPDSEFDLGAGPSSIDNIPREISNVKPHYIFNSPITGKLTAYLKRLSQYIIYFFIISAQPLKNYTGSLPDSEVDPEAGPDTGLLPDSEFDPEAGPSHIDNISTQARSNHLTSTPRSTPKRPKGSDEAISLKRKYEIIKKKYKQLNFKILGAKTQTREIMSIKLMCKRILKNQEEGSHLDDALTASIKRLLPLSTEAELDHLNIQIGNEEFRSNLVSTLSSLFYLIFITICLSAIN